MHDLLERPGVGARRFGFAMPLWRLACALLLGLGAHARAAAADIVAVTEEWAPYNYTSQGAVVGIATDLLREVCESAGLSCEFQVLPWARAYMTARYTRGTLLYTTARTPEREGDFVWIGPLLPRTTWIFVRRDADLQLASVADLKGHRTGVVRGDAAVGDLHSQGVDDASLELATTEETNVRKLMHGRIDAVTGTEIGVAWALRRQGLGKDALRRAVQLSHAGGYYFALNPQTAPEVAQRLRDAFADVQKRQRVDAIVKKYVE